MLTGRRRALALGACLVCSVIVWNVVFDRSVRLAGDRYLDAHAAAPPGGIRAIMEPAIAHAALEATAWTAAVLAVGALIAFFVQRRRRS